MLRPLLLLGGLILLFSLSAHALETHQHALSFSTTGDKMWKDSDTGVSGSFSYALLNQNFPTQTVGGITTTNVHNPLWDAWKLLLDACTALGWSDTQCRDGVVIPNPEYYLVWLPLYETCIWWGWSDSECRAELGNPPPQNITDLVALPAEPAQNITVENGAELTFTNTNLVGGFEGAYSLANGSVDASYSAEAQVSVNPVIITGSLVTLSTSKVSSESPILATVLDGVEANIGAFTRMSARADFEAVQLGVSSIDETILNFDTGMVHQEIVALRIDGKANNLELKVVGAASFEPAISGVEYNINAPGSGTFAGFPMADVTAYLSDLNTPPQSTADPVNPDKVNNSQVPVIGKIDADFDVVTYVGGIAPLGVEAGVPGVAKVELNLLDWDVGAFFAIGQDMSLTVNSISVKFVFSKAVEVETSPGIFTLTSQHTITLGDDLVFRHPGGPLSVTPTYLLTDNSFHNKTNLRIQPAMSTNFIQVKFYGALISDLPDLTLYGVVTPLSPDPIPIHTIFNETYTLQGFNIVEAPAILLDPNEAPTVELSGPATANEGDTKTFSFSVTDADAGDGFTVTAGYPDCGTGGSLVGGSLGVNASGGSFQCVFPDGPATPSVQIQVTDTRAANSNVGSQPVTVSNVSPVVTLAPSFQIVRPGTPLAEVAIGATDVPGDPLVAASTWRKGSDSFVAGLPDEGTDPGGLALNAGPGPGAWTLSGIADLLAPHVYTVRVTVEDGDGGSAYKDITIQTNTPPVAVADDYDATEDVQLTVAADKGVLDNDTDADDDALTAVLDTTTNKGVLNFNADGSFDYAANTDYCGPDSFSYHANDGVEDSNIATVSITVDCVNDPPELISVSPAGQTLDYSDLIHTVTITATDRDDNSLTLAQSGAPLDLPDPGLNTTTDCTVEPNDSIQDGSTCTWTMDGQVLVPGSNVYDIDFTAWDDEPSSSADDFPATRHVLTVDAEDATAILDVANPLSAQVTEEGTEKVDFSLFFAAQESDDPEEDSGLPGSNAQGDMSLARGFMELTPVGPGGVITQECELPSVNGSGYEQLATFECIFTEIPVNTYEVQARVDGETTTTAYFDGLSDESVLVVYDPSLGFTTGGGFFYWPDTAQMDELDKCYPYEGDKTNFAFNFKYNKKQKNIQGNLLMMRHTKDENCVEGNYKVKSNMIEGMGLGTETDSGGPYGWAAVYGKANFRDMNEENKGGNEFLLYTEDHGEQACNQDPADEIWIAVDAPNVWIDPLGPNPSVDDPQDPEDGDALPIFCGNVVIPYDTGKGGGHGKGKPGK